MFAGVPGCPAPGRQLPAAARPKAVRQQAQSLEVHHQTTMMSCDMGPLTKAGPREPLRQEGRRPVRECFDMDDRRGGERAWH